MLQLVTPDIKNEKCNVEKKFIFVYKYNDSCIDYGDLV